MPSRLRLARCAQRRDIHQDRTLHVISRGRARSFPSDGAVKMRNFAQTFLSAGSGQACLWKLMASVGRAPGASHGLPSTDTLRTGSAQCAPAIGAVRKQEQRPLAIRQATPTPVRYPATAGLIDHPTAASHAARGSGWLPGRRTAPRREPVPQKANRPHKAAGRWNPCCGNRISGLRLPAARRSRPDPATH